MVEIKRIAYGGYVLRQLKKIDLEWARMLHNDLAVRNMLTDPTIVSKRRQKLWFQALSESKKSQRLVVECGGDRIGLVRIDDLDFNNKSVAIGLDIDKHYRGLGHAKKVYKILLRHCFKKLKIHRCWLFVADYNAVAYSLYRGLGFIEEGRAREALYRFGKYHDYIMMSILRKEYKA